MKNKNLLIGLLVIAAEALTPAFLIACRAAEQKDVEVKCPSGIDHSAWDRLLKKYVDENGLVNYGAWKNSKEDVDALDPGIFQTSSKTSPLKTSSAKSTPSVRTNLF